MRPEQWVALILSVILLVWVSGAVVIHILRTLGDVSYMPTDGMIDLWKDLMLVLVGGLIGYINGQTKP